MDTYESLQAAFEKARKESLSFITAYNAKLPTERCPKCGDAGHVPGLRCPACGYRHVIAWAILRDTEWGYEAVPLTNRRTVLKEFRVPE